MLNEIEVDYFDGEFDKEFITRNIFLCFFYRFYLKEYSIKKIVKLGIDLIHPDLRENNGVIIKRDELVCVDDVATIWLDFDINQYKKESEYEQRLMVWKVIKSALLKLAALYKVENTPILAVYERGIAENFSFRVETKEVWDNTKNYKANVLIEGDESKFTFKVLFKNKNDEIVDVKEFAQLPPNDGHELPYYFKDFKWKEDVFFIILKNKKVFEVTPSLSLLDRK